MSLMEYAEPERLEAIRTAARASGEGWRVPPPDASLWVDDAALRAWINARTTDHPLRAFEEAIPLKSGADGVERRTYIQAERHSNPRFAEFYHRFAKDPGWRTHRLPTTHDAMLTMPDKIAALLDAAAAEEVGKNPSK